MEFPNNAGNLEFFGEDNNPLRENEFGAIIFNYQKRGIL